MLFRSLEPPDPHIHLLAFGVFCGLVPRARSADTEGRGHTCIQTQEAFAYDAVAEPSCHRHVGLPRLRQNPAERRQEEEMQERDNGTFKIC